MVKIGGAPTEEKWNKLTREQVKSLIFEINQEVSNIVEEMDAKLKLVTLKSSVHEWYNLVSRCERKLKFLRDCFPPYSVESYRVLKELQHRNILKEFKEYSKRKNFQDRYLGLKSEILALEGFIFQKHSVKRKHEETGKQLATLNAQINSDREFLKEAKATIKNLTSTIIREKKAMQREIAHMKRNKANGLQKLSELRETLKQKEALLKETTEQKKREEQALQRELQENKRLIQILNERTTQQKVEKNI